MTKRENTYFGFLIKWNNVYLLCILFTNLKLIKHPDKIELFSQQHERSPCLAIKVNRDGQEDETDSPEHLVDQLDSSFSNGRQRRQGAI